MKPTSCFFRSRFAWIPVFLLAGALLFYGNPPKCFSILVWIAGCWNSLLTSHNPKHNWCLAFLEHSSAEKIAVWAHANCDPNMQEFGFILHEVAKNFELLSKIKDQKQKSKTYSGWGPFQGLSNGTTFMQIQSSRRVPLNNSEKRRWWRSLSYYRLVQLWAGAGPAHPAAAHNTCKVSLCYVAALWVRIQTSLKKTKRTTISKGVANTI
jgi:hypothetical protein